MVEKMPEMSDETPTRASSGKKMKKEEKKSAIGTHGTALINGLDTNIFPFLQI